MIIWQWWAIEKGFCGEFFDCEYEYFPKNTYEEIMEKFEKYSKEGKEKGYFPVIVTVDETLFEELSVSIMR